MTREFTGWHMLALMVGGFGIIIAVNLTLAFNAVATFPGLETKNSYVVSQNFDKDRAAQDALGWDVAVALTETDLTIEITDANGTVKPKVVSAILGRATYAGADSFPDFTWTGNALHTSVDQDPGYWNLRLVLQAPDGTMFRRRFPLTVQAAE
ncbi:Nitrogen fixation protein FixH [Cognatiyoonia koreensis]|uniref:Nitrogen fixation protein FixH n=1 Tax=Cognatiyoonia koreensis TaxID=364200 RepID=A0A1I0RP21_9RHOB|nr:FixH family protein [Cognatiyoonia koreensis]SEW43008.1 Nitrogen fixation protein FixH [Cognatiyoonia koreensis]